MNYKAVVIFLMNIKVHVFTDCVKNVLNMFVISSLFLNLNCTTLVTLFSLCNMETLHSRFITYVENNKGALQKQKKKRMGALFKCIVEGALLITYLIN